MVSVQTHRGLRHYHLVESQVGSPSGHRDEVFVLRSQAVRASHTRARRMARMSGLHVETLAGPGRYLLTTGWRLDPGRLLEVRKCDDPACLTVSRPAPPGS